VSYHTQALLEQDGTFQGRLFAANIQQADYFKDSQLADEKALAAAIMRDDPGPAAAFLRLACAGPGISDKVDKGDGTIDQSQVTDADLLSLTQGDWPVVTGLYFNVDGSPKP